MTFFSKRKRKNDDPPRFPAWIIVVVAIGLVVIIGLIFEIRSTQTVASQTSGGIDLTGTYIIDFATRLAQGTPQPTSLDPLLMTATRLVEMATSQAQGTPQPITINSAGGQLDPLEITATHIVLQVTMTAQAGGS